MGIAAHGIRTTGHVSTRHRTALPARISDEKLDTIAARGHE
jgi:hypothetical protein